MENPGWGTGNNRKTGSTLTLKRQSAAPTRATRMKDNKQRVTDRRTGFVCTELPVMASSGLSVALERRHVRDRRARSIEFDRLEKEGKV